MKAELPKYLAVAEDVSADTPALQWWESNADKLPCWAKACKKVLLCQPSSDSVERVFSILAQFSDKQRSALEQYVETSIMLQYNK